MTYYEVKQKVRSFYDKKKNDNVNCNEVYEYVVAHNTIANARDLSFLVAIAIEEVKNENQPSVDNNNI